MKEKAESTFKAVVGLYKGNEKSDNKKYENPQNDKQKNRNFQQEKNTALLEDSRSKTKNLSPAAAGELLFKMDTYVGNCGEMACLTLYVAHTFYHVPEDQLHLQTCTANCSVFSSAHGFSHTIALLGQLNGDLWVVDPWSNICCSCGDYIDTFKNKMKAWAEKGKRIGVPGTFCGTNWLMPNHADILTLFDGKEAKFMSYRQSVS